MSKSELHDWEYDIEESSGNNAEKMLEIAQDIYNTAFVRGRNSMTWEQTRWIPVSERLPNPGEYNEDVDRYYLVQNEYSDMLVARYAKKGYWEQIYQFGEIKEKIVAWQPLPEAYKEER